MKNYIDLCYDILAHGIDIGTDRTGTGTRSVYGRMLKFNLSDGFPLVTVKRTYWKGVVEELLWFLRGETNIKSLQARNVHIWDEWATEEGELGPVYGSQWRNYEGIDQIAECVRLLKTEPYSRRNLVLAWNPPLLPTPKLSPKENVMAGFQALPPCHTMFQVNVDGEGFLHLQLYQRSADVFLGVPFNIASYSLLLMMLAHHTGYKPGTFTWFGGDCHLYKNHFEQTKEMLNRMPKQRPTVRLNYPKETNLWDVKFEDIELVGYECHPAIKGEVSV